MSTSGAGCRVPREVRSSSSENLSTIHEKSLEYLGSGGSSPANLRELVRRSDLNSAQLVCPSTGAEYHHEAGALQQPGRILCYDPAPHRFEVFWYLQLHRHVLFSDGRVEWLGESEFSKLFHEDEGR
ncbi:MAG: hypothetical protein HY720_08880 [Planctomycetes bacterium]|nr:hypothetical protein [Planctomycetota bacterium]